MFKSTISFALLSAALSSAYELSVWELPGVHCKTLDGYYEEPPLWTYTDTVTETRLPATITVTSQPYTNAMLTATSTSTITTSVTSTTTETTWQYVSSIVPTSAGFEPIDDTVDGWPTSVISSTTTIVTSIIPSTSSTTVVAPPKRSALARREIQDKCSECSDEGDCDYDCPQRVQCEKVVVVQEIYYTTSQAPASTKYIQTTAWTKTTTTLTSWETTTETVTATATSYDACGTDNVIGPLAPSGTIYSFRKTNNSYNLTEIGTPDNGTDCCIACQLADACAASVYSANGGCILISPSDPTTCPVGSNNALAGYYEVGNGTSLDEGDYYTVSNGNCGYLEEDDGQQPIWR